MERKSIGTNNRNIQTTGRLDLAIVYNVEWQLIRISMLAKFSTDGHTFGTLAGIQKNYDRCMTYIEDAAKVFDRNTQPAEFEYEEFIRTYRVSNLWQATLLSTIAGKEREELSSVAKEFQRKLSVYVDAGWKLESFDWTTVEEDLATAHRQGKYSQLKNLRANLQGRMQKGINRTGGTQSRVELHKFVALLDEELKTGKVS